MENVVFVQLKKKELSGEIDLFYWESRAHEVDFVIKEGLNIRRLIQVTYAEERDEVKKREVEALLKASDALRCKDLLCITWDYEGEEKIKRKRVKFVPLWRWLLQERAEAMRKS